MIANQTIKKDHRKVVFFLRTRFVLRNEMRFYPEPEDQITTIYGLTQRFIACTSSVNKIIAGLSPRRRDFETHFGLG